MFARMNFFLFHQFQGRANVQKEHLSIGFFFEWEQKVGTKIENTLIILNFVKIESGFEENGSPDQVPWMKFQRKISI